MHYKIKELHRLITTLKSEEGLSDYGVTLLEGYAVGLETVVKNCSIPAVVGQSEQLVCDECCNEGGTFGVNGWQKCSKGCKHHSKLIAYNDNNNSRRDCINPN